MKIQKTWYIRIIGGSKGGAWGDCAPPLGLFTYDVSLKLPKFGPPPSLWPVRQHACHPGQHPLPPYEIWRQLGWNRWISLKIFGHRARPLKIPAFLWFWRPTSDFATTPPSLTVLNTSLFRDPLPPYHCWRHMWTAPKRANVIIWNYLTFWGKFNSVTRHCL